VDQVQRLATIARAAEATGISRRTIERAIKDGRLRSWRSDTDRRIRLVNLSDVAAIAGDRNQAANHASSHNPFQPVIDDALRVLYSHYYRLGSQIGAEPGHVATLDELRGSAVGRDLALLGRIASGEALATGEHVSSEINRIVDLYFRQPLTHEVIVPRSFWDSGLGRMLSRAKLQSYHHSDLLSVGAVARELGVSRPTIYRWIDDRFLDGVYDEVGGRTFVTKQSLRQLIEASPRQLSLADAGSPPRFESVDDEPSTSEFEVVGVGGPL
jgi:excisionase family DNA binding protein